MGTDQKNDLGIDNHTKVHYALVGKSLGSECVFFAKNSLQSLTSLSNQSQMSFCSFDCSLGRGSSAKLLCPTMHFNLGQGWTKCLFLFTAPYPLVLAGATSEMCRIMTKIVQSLYPCYCYLAQEQGIPCHRFWLNTPMSFFGCWGPRVSGIA